MYSQNNVIEAPTLFGLAKDTFKINFKWFRDGTCSDISKPTSLTEDLCGNDGHLTTCKLGLGSLQSWTIRIGVWVGGVSTHIMEKFPNPDKKNNQMPTCLAGL